jgi:N utilization substance protein A
MQIGYDSLVALPGVGIGLADALYESGFYSAEEISRATIEDLIQIRGIGEEKAEKLLEAAHNAIAQSEADTNAESSSDTVANNEPGEEEIGPQTADDQTAGIDDSSQSEQPSDEADSDQKID